MTSEGYDCTFLESVVPADRVRVSEGQREQFALDASAHEPHLPDAVVHAESAEEVAAVLEAANERGVPVTPWSAGTGIEGNAVPVEGGIALSTRDIDHVDVRPDDLQVTVGPGVVYDDLNEQLARHGIRFPPGISSGESAMIGGMIATNASGLNAVRYGETRDHVLRLEVALPDGRVIECGRDVIKTSSGYSLKDLFIGSEGTLGVVTEATLSLDGIPEHRRAALVTFPDRTSASTAVSELIRYGLDPGAVEFVDALTVELINEYRDDVDLPEETTLIVELHSNTSGIEEDVSFARSICEDAGATNWREAEDDREEIWLARRDAYPAYEAYREDLIPTAVGDVVVPISKYPEIVATVEELAEEYDIMTPTVGHAGDGNLHYAPMVDPDDDAAMAQADELNERIVAAAIEMGGTATGEHGIGIGKRKFMSDEHGEALSVMSTIKDAIDPNGIMNPGKVLPDREE